MTSESGRIANILTGRSVSLGVFGPLGFMPHRKGRHLAVWIRYPAHARMHERSREAQVPASKNVPSLVL